MNATPVSVGTLFVNKVQYRIPLYQRRYGWDKTSWEVLWQNILDQARGESSENTEHFTGPIVTREKQQHRFEVIDGQQRLMTFQIIFCAIRDLCEFFNFCDLKKQVEKHLRNKDTDITDLNIRVKDSDVKLPDPTNKFFPSGYDELVFEAIVKEDFKIGKEVKKGYGKNIHTAFNEGDEYPVKDKVKEIRSKVFGENTVSLILDAYDYFYQEIRRYVLQGPEEETLEKRISNLFKIIRFRFELVVIKPGTSQRAEEIFQSVNATGRKLSEFDYLRNDLFLRAGNKSECYYENYWIFENDPDDYDWNNNRLESFFQAFLMAKLGPDVLNKNPKLFDVYHQDVSSQQSIKEEFENIKNYAGIYKKLNVDSQGLNVDPEFKTRMQFYEDLRAYENEERHNSDFGSRHHYNVTVIRSFIMHLQQELKMSRDEILEILEILESYIVRRMLIDTVTGHHAYDTIKAFFSNLFKPRPPEFTVENLLEHLVDNQSWLSNDVVGNWFKGNEGNEPRQSDWFALALSFTERYIFYRIENQKRTDANEELLSFTTTEFPTYRKRVRTLTQLSYAEDAWASLGNLTFCWENGARQGKDELDDEIGILKHDVNRKLRLNSEICDEPKWDPDKINKREEELFSIFRKIWKENSIIEKRRGDIKKKYQVGSEVRGRVVNIKKFGVFVELELGIDGLVHVSEMAWTSRKVEPAEIVSEGQSVIVKILEISEKEQRIRLSLKQMQPDPWVEFRKERKVGSVVQGRIVELTDFGAFAELGEGIEGLIHISELSYRRIEKPKEIVSVGNELDLKVIELDPTEKRISLSLKAMQPDPWVEVPEKYEVGSVVRGRIVNLTHFGAFAELEEGIESLIHISELSYRRIEKPKEIVSVGDELDLKVIELDPTEKRISLSLKAMQPDPWVEVPEKYEVGSVVRGRIVSLTHFGALAELEEGIEGLIRISELADRRIEKPEEIVSVRDELDLKVIELDPTEKRISLSLKAMQPDPWVEVPEKYEVGSVVRGRIVNLTSFGAFTELEEGIEGLIHISELSYRRIEKPKEIVSVGDELDLKVIELDPTEKRISLSLKAMQPDLWVEVPEKYEVGSVVRGRIVNLTSFGAFAELEEGIEGLIHISELADPRPKRSEEIVSVGEELDVKIIRLDKETRRIALSLKAVVKRPRKDPLPQNRRRQRSKAAAGDEPVTSLGTLLKEAIKIGTTGRSED